MKLIAKIKWEDPYQMDNGSREYFYVIYFNSKTKYLSAAWEHSYPNCFDKFQRIPLEEILAECIFNHGETIEEFEGENRNNVRRAIIQWHGENYAKSKRKKRKTQTVL